MSPRTLLSNFQARGIRVTAADGKLSYWPQAALTQKDLGLLRALKPQIMQHLAGFDELKPGTQIITEVGIYRISHLYPEIGRVSGIQLLNETPRIFDIADVASKPQTEFLKKRIETIESQINELQPPQLNNDFRLFEPEWRHLMAEIQRQMTLIEQIEIEFNKTNNRDVNAMEVSNG